MLSFSLRRSSAAGQARLQPKDELLFVAIAQAFGKVPSLRALAPTQSEPPFLITESLTLALFVILGAIAVRNYRRGAAATLSA